MKPSLKQYSVGLLLVLSLSISAQAASDSLERGKRAFESGKMRDAVTYFDQAILSARSVSDRNLSYYYQGLALFEMGYYFSAYRSFRMVLLKPDPKNKPVYGKAIKNAVVIMDRLNLVDRVGKLVVKLPGAYIPQELNHMVHYAAGVHHYSENNFSAAESRLKSVNPESQFYLKALFYLGVIATRKKDYNDAIVYFNKVAQLSSNRRGSEVMEDLAKLNLARSLYSRGKLEASIEAFARFTSGSPFWLDVLLEASWPLMRMNDSTVSLGNLHTLTSPFYRESLVGEAYVLKATILFALCKYEEMRRTLNDFFEIYDPILRAMEKEKGVLDSPMAFFNAYTRKAGLNRAYVSVIDRDPGISHDLKVRELLQEERMRLGVFARMKTINAIKETLDKVIGYISTRVGKDLMSIHSRHLRQLVAQREQANYLKVEIITGEKELIEKSKGLPAKRVTDVETKVFAGYHYWPFQGEYWEDELGSYVYTTESSCVD
ncbi:MAG: tetratricopeptide repeat protein [Bdellovibrionaceae bacterium]|nr:tetratricopeptide repeat protein [Bdellovibrionales bacterium]MCB9253737.1 tetratricopeptide repeat protein [Pseudobdellovibrionaceae bacterium]